MLRGKLRRHFRNSGFIVTGIAHNQRAFAQLLPASHQPGRPGRRRNSPKHLFP